MEIRFGTSDLARLCNCAASIDRRWGKLVGAAIRERLCLLAGTPTLDLLNEFSGLLMEPISLDKQGVSRSLPFPIVTCLCGQITSRFHLFATAS